VPIWQYALLPQMSNDLAKRLVKAKMKIASSIRVDT
jgi:hypothetical protein